MTDTKKHTDHPVDTVTSEQAPPNDVPKSEVTPEKKEYGGPKGLEPTRYGDWEKSGRCIDF